MTKIAIAPNASGTGTFTIAAPNSNVDRTFSLPDATGEVLTDQSDLAAAKLTGDVAAGRITTALNAGGSAPIYACRAWVNFNGTGTVAIRASGNVSSITDNGTGDYTINFTTAMPDANYSVAGAARRSTNTGSLKHFVAINHFDNAMQTTSCRVITSHSGTVQGEDAEIVTVNFCR